jgi:hypothetical protein
VVPLDERRHVYDSGSWGILEGGARPDEFVSVAVSIRDGYLIQAAVMVPNPAIT